jgi:hypothetical protein
VYEEIGIVVSRADLVPFATFSDPVDHRLVYPSGDVVHAFALCLAASTWRGDPRPDRDEVIEWGSFCVDRPPSPLRLSPEGPGPLPRVPENGRVSGGLASRDSAAVARDRRPSTRAPGGVSGAIRGFALPGPRTSRRCDPTMVGPGPPRPAGWAARRALPCKRPWRA